MSGGSTKKFWDLSRSFLPLGLQVSSLQNNNLEGKIYLFLSSLGLCIIAPGMRSRCFKTMGLRDKRPYLWLQLSERNPYGKGWLNFRVSQMQNALNTLQKFYEISCGWVERGATWEEASIPHPFFTSWGESLEAIQSSSDPKSLSIIQTFFCPVPQNKIWHLYPSYGANNGQMYLIGVQSWWTFYMRLKVRNQYQ